MVLGSSPVAVTSPSDFAPASSKEFLDIQATVECRFTLKRVRDMTRTYSHNHNHNENENENDNDNDNENETIAQTFYEQWSSLVFFLFFFLFNLYVVY